MAAVCNTVITRVHIHADDQSQADAFVTDFRLEMERALGNLERIHTHVTVIPAEVHDDDDQG